MRKSALFMALAAALTLGALHVGSGTASAQASLGAEHINQSDCIGTFCFSIQGVSNCATTPSGNQSCIFVGQECFTIGTYFSKCQRVTSHDNFQQQLYHFSSKGQYTVFGQTCTFRVNYTVANGAVRVNRYQDSCANL